jgi:mono/diheme cytochrome c family protein
MQFKKTASVITFAALASVAVAQESGPISAGDARKLKNPVPYSKKSFGQGKQVFLRMCAGCHGNDGKSTLDVVADATDLTDQKAYKNGYSEGEIFRSIRDGQSASMPSFRTQIKSEEDLWHLVNFIESLWPESQRPKESASK